MSDRVEYWWVARDAVTQPAEITFRGGIPYTVRFIGSGEILLAANVDLMDRLPLAPAPTPARRTDIPPVPRAPEDRSIKIAWLIGFIVITLLLWFSGPLFDAIR